MRDASIFLRQHGGNAATVYLAPIMTSRAHRVSIAETDVAPIVTLLHKRPQIVTRAAAVESRDEERAKYQMSDESMKESKPVLTTDASVPFYLPVPYTPAKSRISIYVDEPMNRMPGGGQRRQPLPLCARGKQEAEKQLTGEAGD